MYAFGPGSVFIKPPSTAADTTPRKVMEVSEVNVDISQESKDVYGTDIDALMVALTKRKITGKLKQSVVQGSVLAAMQGYALSTGSRVGVPGESTGTIAGATYTAANPTGFEDYGVRDENNMPLKLVATGPIAGQYAVTTGGVYTFHTSATGKVYTISYSYTVATGSTLSLDTRQMGIAPQFALKGFGTTADGFKFGWEFPAVVFPKLALPFKNEDFTMPDIDFQAFRPIGATTIGKLYFPDSL